MKRKQLILIIIFVFGAFQCLNAQGSKLVIIHLNNGYSIKGEILERNSENVKIKTLNGEILVYNVAEINRTEDAAVTPAPTKIFSPSKIVTKSIEKGDKLINIGIALVQQNNIQVEWYYSEKLTLPSFPVSFEYVIKDNLFKGSGALGLGGVLEYTSLQINNGKDKHSRFILGARGYLHYAFVEKLDTYAGVTLAYRGDAYKYESESIPNISDGSLMLNAFVGGRYFFTDRFAGMAEVGWGISIVTIGVCFKL